MEQSSDDLPVLDVFAINEEAFAIHNDAFYPVKILAFRKEGKGDDLMYKVHYKNWSKRWDEWVFSDRLFRTVPESAKTTSEEPEGDGRLSKRKRVQRPPSEEKKGKSVSVFLNLIHWEQRRQKSKSQNTEEDGDQGDSEEEDDDGEAVEADEDGSEEEEEEEDEDEDEDEEDSEDDATEVTSGRSRNGEEVLAVRIPRKLRMFLLQEYELICHSRFLHPLPRTPTVEEILKAEEDDQDADVVEGIKNYFDRALSKILLYSPEMGQFEEVHERGLPCQIYGAEHLLRLFVKLPELLLDQLASFGKESRTLLEKVHYVLKYLEEHPAVFLEKHLFVKQK